MLEINLMKANSIVATLLIAAVVHADAHFASPYPRKAIAPDESAGWIVINGNAWTHSARSESDRHDCSIHPFPSGAIPFRDSRSNSTVTIISIDAVSKQRDYLRVGY